MMAHPCCSGLPSSRRRFHIPSAAARPGTRAHRRGRMEGSARQKGSVVLAFFGARGAFRAVLLTLVLSAPLPSGAEAPETAFAEVFSRSEEHTSELQSRFDLVCRLLLDKKRA